MRRCLALILSLVMLLGVCPVFAESAATAAGYSTEAADVFCDAWNQYYAENGVDLSVGYVLTDDQRQIESFDVLFNAGQSRFNYLSGVLPKEAKVYRIGGDEFGVIFRGTLEREEIFLLLNDLKNGYDVKTPDGVRQTITVGMATAFEDASRGPELVRKADSALYRAKVSGGNRVTMAREEKMVPKTSHYTQDQLQRLAKLGRREGIGEAILLREALDMLLKKYDI